MEEHPNLSAYNDVENLTRFTDESFRNYCRSKLGECKDEVEFIRANCIGNDWSGKICEIGSGNSKLLYALEIEKLLEAGIGYETSPSRYKAFLQPMPLK